MIILFVFLPCFVFMMSMHSTTSGRPRADAEKCLLDEMSQSEHCVFLVACACFHSSADFYRFH